MSPILFKIIKTMKKVIKIQALIIQKSKMRFLRHKK